MYVFLWELFNIKFRTVIPSKIYLLHILFEENNKKVIKNNCIEKVKFYSPYWTEPLIKISGKVWLDSVSHFMINGTLSLAYLLP